MAVLTTVFWALSLVLILTGSCESKNAGCKVSKNGESANITIKLDDVLADLDKFKTQASDLVQNYGTLQGHCTLVAHDPLEAKARSCADTSDGGVTTIYPDGVTPLTVYCDQDTDGGGWTVFQRRQDGSVDFYRNWTEYQRGFGDPNGEFWLGLDTLYMLTSRQTCELRVDLSKFGGTEGYVTYSNFSISDSSDNYRLHLGRFTGGNVSDALLTQVNYEFSTHDADHDTWGTTNCARVRHGAWWYGSCTSSNLNGRYKHSRVTGEDGVVWYYFDNWFSLKFTEMKLRPV